MSSSASPADNAGWFWKLFGSAIIGVIAMLLLNNLNSISNNVYNVKSETNTAISTLKSEIDLKLSKNQSDVSALLQQIGRLEANMISLDALLKQYQDSCKERLVLIETGLKERTTYSESNVTALREADKDLAKQVGDLREKIVLIEEKLAKLRESAAAAAVK